RTSHWRSLPSTQRPATILPSGVNATSRTSASEGITRSCARAAPAASIQTAARISGLLQHDIETDGRVRRALLIERHGPHQFAVAHQVALVVVLIHVAFEPFVGGEIYL